MSKLLIKLPKIDKDILFSFLQAILLIGAYVYSIIKLSHMNFDSMSTFYASVLSCILFLIVCALFLVLISNFLTRNIWASLLLLMSLLTILSGNTYPVISLIYFFYSSVCVGQLFLLLCYEGGSDNTLLRYLLGSGFYAFLVGISSHFKINYSFIYLVILSLPIFAVHFLSIAKSNKNKLDNFFVNLKAGLRFNLIDLLIAIAFLAYFYTSMLPELGWDALWMHMFVASKMKLDHFWSFDPSLYVFSVIPMLGDWFFSIAYVISGEVGARLMNFMFICLISTLLRDLVLYVRKDETAAKLAVLLFLTMPLSYAEGTTLFVECVWTSFILASVLFFLKFCEDPKGKERNLMITSIFLGLAMNAKLLTLSFFPSLFLLVIYRVKRFLNLRPVLVLASLIIFLAIASYPYLNAMAITGNPVFPFYNEIFKSSYYPLVNFQDLRWEKGLSWDFLSRFTFQSNKFIESPSGSVALGFQWIFLLIPLAPLFFYIKEKKDILFISFISVLSFLIIACKVEVYFRYLFPSLVMLMACLGLLISYALKVKSYVKPLLFISLTTTIVLNFLFLTLVSYYPSLPLKPVFSEDAREKYLLKRLPMRNAIQYINTINTNRSPVVNFSDPYIAGINSDVLYIDWTNFDFQNEFIAVNSPSEMKLLLLSRGVDFFIYQKGWLGAGCCGDKWPEKSRYLEAISQEIANFNSVTIRKVVK